VQREQAQSLFSRGRELFRHKKYDEALAQFRASHEIVASPNTRLEIARCLRELKNPVAAYVEFGRAAIEAQELVSQDHRYQRAYDAAMAEREDLAPQLGFATIHIENPSDGTVVKVGGEEMRRAAWAEPVPLAAGTTEIVVETPGHAPVTKTVTVAAGQQAALSVDAQSGDLANKAALPPPQPSPEPSSWTASARTWSYVAGGVGAAGMLTFAIFGSMAQSNYDDLTRACPAGPCGADKASEISSGKTQETVANVGLALGIAGLATGAALFVVSLPRGNATPSAALVVMPGGAGVRGAW
jgi:hypothetical protein